jgi:hypothetical protein
MNAAQAFSPQTLHAPHGPVDAAQERQAWLHTPITTEKAGVAIIIMALAGALNTAQVRSGSIRPAFWVPCVATVAPRRAAILTLHARDGFPASLGGPLRPRASFRPEDVARPFASPDAAARNTLAALPNWWLAEDADSACICVVETPLGDPAPESLLPLPVFEATWPL